MELIARRSRLNTLQNRLSTKPPDSSSSPSNNQGLFIFMRWSPTACGWVNPSDVQNDYGPSGGVDVWSGKGDLEKTRRSVSCYRG